MNPSKLLFQVFKGADNLHDSRLSMIAIRNPHTVNDNNISAACIQCISDTAFRILKYDTIFNRDTNYCSSRTEHRYLIRKGTIVVDDSLGREPTIKAKGANKEINVGFNGSTGNCKWDAVCCQQLKKCFCTFNQMKAFFVIFAKISVICFL